MAPRTARCAGDDLLVGLADGLRRRLRASDVTGRLSAEAALRAADEALYEAKRMGRDCVAEWAPTTESFIPASD